MRLDDEPLGGRSNEVKRIASDQREEWSADVVQHIHVVRRDDPRGLDLVEMRPIGSGKHNFVSVTDIPQSAEKRVTVAGERDVSFAAWHRGARNVSDAQSESVIIRSLHNDRRNPHAWDADASQQRPRFRHRIKHRFHGPEQILMIQGRRALLLIEIHSGERCAVPYQGNQSERYKDATAPFQALPSCRSRHLCRAFCDSVSAESDDAAKYPGRVRTVH